MQRPILVFDSGIGGLSVLAEIRKRLPNRDYVYLFDNARLPYGELAEEDLIQGCIELVVSVVKQVNAALVVIACNTASTLVLPGLRAALSIPVVGVVPAIKPAAKLSQHHEIGLLATPGTITRGYTRTLIECFASSCKVHLFSSSELVMLAEKKMSGEPLAQDHIDKLLAEIHQTQLDVLVLGCTHFPMLKPEIQSSVGTDVILLDSGDAVARRVASLLQDSVLSPGKVPSMTGFYTKDELTEGLVKSLTNMGFSALLQIPPNRSYF